MGQNILMLIVFTAASMGMEGMVLAKFKPLARFIQKYPIATLPLSLGLSWLLGLVFGAHGWVIMGAGILSTVLMQLLYSASWKIGSFFKARKSSTSNQPNWTTVGTTA